MPAFEPFDKYDWSRFAQDTPPSIYFKAGDHEILFTVRLGRMLQGRFAEKLRQGQALTLAEFTKIADIVDYQGRTRLADGVCLQILRHYWLYGDLLPSS